MEDQLWWLNRPMCLEWPEKEDETPNGFRWLVELVQRMHDALAPTQTTELSAKLEIVGDVAGTASGRRWQASTHRRNL